MKQGTSTITTVFTSEINDLTYEYEVSQQAGKTPHMIVFRVKRDNQFLATGSNRPLDGYFGFETQTKLSAEERTAINEQVNADLEAVIQAAENINIVTPTTL